MEPPPAFRYEMVGAVPETAAAKIRVLLRNQSPHSLGPPICPYSGDDGGMEIGGYGSQYVLKTPDVKNRGYIMMKKHVVCILAIMLLLLTGCNKKQDVPAQTDAQPGIAAEATTVPAETRASIPGVEDSIFDDETGPAHEETTASDESTKPTEAETPEETKPQETEPETDTSQPADKQPTAYEKFHNMSAAEQQAFMETFDSLDSFFVWYNNVKAEYEAANPPIDVGDGRIDMGELMN